MATLLSSLETKARRRLIETTASFWSSQDLIDIINEGIKDLWGAIIDLHQEHFMTVDETTMSLAASATSVTGVPSDMFRVLIIEPRDTSSTGSQRNVIFVPRDYNSEEFINARSMDTQNPTSPLSIYYTVTQPGPPSGTATILVAPKLSSALNLRIAYIPTQAAVAAGGNNPIPGESDNALIAWCIAYARSSEREDRSPDPNWLAVYATEKQSIITRLTPRQEQEPEIVPAMFESLW